MEGEVPAIAGRSGLLANDTPVNLRVKGFTNLDAGRPRLFDADLTVASDGSFHFAPPARFFGNYRFTYTAENLSQQSGHAVVDIRVVPTDIDLDAIIQGIGGYVLYGSNGERFDSAVAAIMNRTNPANPQGVNTCQCAIESPGFIACTALRRRSRQPDISAPAL